MANDFWATNFFFDASSADILMEPAPAGQVLSGMPETGYIELGIWSGQEVGVWEMSPGIMSDVEVDEVCVILRGTGSVQRTIGGAAVQQELKPGAVFELHEGEETIWTVSQSVRKIYLSPAAS
ncbi:MAG: hypothetical protein RI926_905 [Actinomycetota bacterium]|jgi:uncharacterized cupin superfamily protein